MSPLAAETDACIEGTGNSDEGTLVVHGYARTLVIRPQSLPKETLAASPETLALFDSLAVAAESDHAPTATPSTGVREATSLSGSLLKVRRKFSDGPLYVSPFSNDLPLLQRKSLESEVHDIRNVRFKQVASTSGEHRTLENETCNKACKLDVEAGVMVDETVRASLELLDRR